MVEDLLEIDSSEIMSEVSDLAHLKSLSESFLYDRFEPALTVGSSKAFEGFN